MRLLRPMDQMAPDQARGWSSRSTHMAHRRMGFGGTRNSNVGQRLANFIIYVHSHFMAILEAPALGAATGYLKHWITTRAALGGSTFYGHARRHASHMYTDDLIGLAVTGACAVNFMVAVYLTAQHLRILLAGMHKTQIGTGLRVIGGTLLVMLGVAAIPAYKRAHGTHQLTLVLNGACTYEAYEKLVGLLVLFLAGR